MRERSGLHRLSRRNNLSSYVERNFPPPLFSNTKSLFFFFVVDVHMVQGEEERRRKGRASSAAANSPLLPLSSVSPSLFLLPPLVTKGIKCVTFAKKKSSEFNFVPVHILLLYFSFDAFFKKNLPFSFESGEIPLCGGGWSQMQVDLCSFSCGKCWMHRRSDGRDGQGALSSSPL